jgi:hypothetical protein
MSRNLSVICRQVGLVQPRSYIVRSISTQYIPGRKGYAPGFEAPEGTRETTKMIPKRRDIGRSLTSHLSSSNNNKKEELATTSTKKLYRQELKVTRHKYARELLEKQGQKELISAEKLAITEQKKQELKVSFENEKEQQKQHEQQVVEMLSLNTDVNTNDNKVNDRNEKRIENRLALEQEQRNTRRKQLLKLYTNTDNFVTLDNLDAKVDAIISNEGRSFHESLHELMHNTNSVQSEIEQRKLQLKEVMGL